MKTCTWGAATDACPRAALWMVVINGDPQEGILVCEEHAHHAAMYRHGGDFEPTVNRVEMESLAAGQRFPLHDITQ